MIVQNVSTEGTGRTDISFTLPKADGPTAMAALSKIQEQINFKGLLYDDHVGKVSLIGAGMRSHPGVAAKFFAALGEAGVNIEMISTSEIRVSVVCRDTDLDAAVRAVHDAFELGGDERGGRLRRHRAVSRRWPRCPRSPSSAPPAPSAPSCASCSPPARTSGARSGWSRRARSAGRKLSAAAARS